MKILFILLLICTYCFADSLDITSQLESDYIFQEEQLFQILTHITPSNYDSKRVPLDLTIVIDTSGSMSGDPMLLTKRVLEFLSNELHAQDRIAIIEYSLGAAILLPPTTIDENGKHQALQRINNLHAGGGTNLNEGLLEGLRITNSMIQQERITQNGEAVPVLILMSDGHANIGDTDINSITNNIYKTLNIKYNSPIPFSIYTFGLGKHIDYSLLSSIAEIGNGAFFHVDSSNKIGESLSGLVGNIFNTITKNTKVHIQVPDEFINDISIKTIDTLYFINKITEHHYEIYFGDIQQGSKKDFLITLKINEDSSIKDDNNSHLLNILNIWWEGYDFIEDRETKKGSLHNISINRKYLDTNDKITRENQKKSIPNEIIEEKERIQAAKIIDKAYKEAEQGNYDKSKKLLQSTAKVITSDEIKLNLETLSNIVYDIGTIIANKFEIGSQTFSGISGSIYENNGAKQEKENYKLFDSTIRQHEH